MENCKRNFKQLKQEDRWLAKIINNGIAHYIYEWIRKNKSNEFTKIEFSFLWYKMIYSVTDTEDDAWELFFKLSYEYLDCLEAEVNKE